MSRPWYLRVIAPEMVPEAKPPSPLLTSHSGESNSSRDWLALSHGNERLVKIISGSESKWVSAAFSVSCAGLFERAGGIQPQLRPAQAIPHAAQSLPCQDRRTRASRSSRSFPIQRPAAAQGELLKLV